MSNHFKCHLRTGPGGLNCPCCFFKPGKIRKKAFRSARRRHKLAELKNERRNYDGNFKF
jgi:hypothetical protein